MAYRRAGGKYMLVEYGPLVLDLELRLRVHALMTWLQQADPGGIIELTPGIRSLQVHYDPRILPLEHLMETLVEAEEALPGLAELLLKALMRMHLQERSLERVRAARLPN